ncbi:MAG: hypothetical protein J0H01_22520 [Rhizobiales bacterium]|nr:hypothetical protein [Hyphomicrobiales bacterium]
MNGRDRGRGRALLAIRAGLAFASLAVAVTAAAAQPERRGDPLRDLLSAGTSGRLCYARSYQADHLAEHPQQRVTTMTLSLKRGRASPAEFQIFVTVRGDRDLWSAGGECQASGSIVCSVECDGGGFSIAGNATPQAVLLNLEQPHGRISMNGCDGGEREVEAGADDRRFRLDRVANAVCDAAARRAGSAR